MSLQDDLLEDEFKKLAERLNDIYSIAEKAILAHSQKYLARYQNTEKTVANDVKTGAMSESDAKTVLKNEIFTGYQWETEKEALAEELYDADLEATEYGNSRLDSIYVQSKNYGSYQAEMHYRRDLGLTALTIAALTAEEKPTPRLLNTAKDIAWNRKVIQSSFVKHLERAKTLKEIGRRSVKLITNRNRNATNNAFEYLFWGVADEGKWESMMQLQKLGIEVEKEWLATLDKHTRDTHRILDGEVMQIDKNFEVNGFKIMYPRQPSAPPAMTINCRCRLKYNFPKYSDTNHYRRENMKIGGERQTIPYMTYQEWEEWKLDDEFYD